MRIVAALGGNALLERGDIPDAAVELRHVRAAAASLAPLCADHDVLISHGNGPQVGLLALESAADLSLTEPYPLDALGAQTQGLIGYWLAQELRNAGVTKPIAAIVTQTLVDASDPAFRHPTKFIGPTYSRETAADVAARHGWAIAADGTSWRRVVASPLPRDVVELPAITALSLAGHVVICGGGGGAPVLLDGDGCYRGVEAVVDKDLVAALLAHRVSADMLLLLTDVAAVLRDYGTDHATPISCLDVEEAGELALPAGSMGPKVQACRTFVGSTGGTAVIGALTDAVGMLRGDAGTRIVAHHDRGRTGGEQS